MENVFNVMAVVSIVVAFLSLYIAYRSLSTEKQSMDTLNRVRKDLGIEFEKVKATNQETRSLIERITRLFSASEKEGMEMVYPNRLEALMAFTEYIRGEDKEVVIIGSSLLGLFHFVSNLDEIVRTKPGKFRFILTHPMDSIRREAPEGRDNGVIQGEIKEGIHKLIAWGVPPENIQLYKGSPTVFMIMTSSKMLLNPYPYGTEAWRCFCVQVSSTGTIYAQYREKHFEKIWNSQWTESCKQFVERQ